MNETKRSVKRRVIAMSMTLVLMIPLLTACMGGSNEEPPAEQVLRLANDYGYVGEFGEAFREFTELYEFSNPHVTLEYVQLVDENRYYYGNQPMDEEQPNPYEKLKKAMTGPNPPDVVFISYEHLGDMIDENLLAPLDAYMTRDEFDVSKLVPAVVEGIKRYGDGQMYALSPFFSSSALIYNQEVFDANGVPYPTGEENWQELFDLATRVSNGEEQYGFSFTNYEGNDPFWDLQQYVAPLELTMFDDSGDHMTVNSPQWADAWETIIRLQRENITPPPPNYEDNNNWERPNNPFQHDLFMSGRVAMTIVDSSYLNQIIDANKNQERIEGFDGIRWDIVALPTHPEAPGIGGNVWLNGLMAINAKAQNIEGAWDFINFVNGEEFARIKSKSSYQLMSYKEYNKPKGGESYNMEAFYKLSPAPAQDLSDVWRKYPNIWEVQNIGQTKFRQVLNDEKTVEDALAEWQNEGDAMLREMRENPQSGDFGGGPIPFEATTEVISEEEAIKIEAEMKAAEEAEAAVEVDAGVEAD